MSVCAVVGGQFGSEGKGLIVGHIAKNYGYHVRVGAANAGHTIWTKDPGQPDDGDVLTKHVMQQVPCAAYANPSANLFIGPGAQISPDIFAAELQALAAWREQRGMLPLTIEVDPRAHIIQPEHIRREQASGLAERIGSTSTIAKEGIGAAQAARVMRDESCVPAAKYFDAADYQALELAQHIYLSDVPAQLNALMKMSGSVLLEGTQGTSLSLTTGAFPYVTSRNTTAAGLAADCGVAPNALDRVIMVCRAFPIRVAGNSGPFWPESEELDWEDLGIDPESERTTVTKKIRRVATMSVEQIVYNAALNGATELALTFADYLDPEIADGTAPRDADMPAVASVIRKLEDATRLPVTYVGTGPSSVIER